MKYFTCFLFMLITHLSFAQDYGGLRGTIIEEFSQEPIQYASLSLQLEGAFVAQTRADVHGAYLFIDIEAGNYDLIISKLGLSPLKITNVFITPNKISELNLTFEASGFDQDTIVFTYSELQQKSLKPNHQISKKHCTKRQLRAARKLEKQIIH
ncbi:MAG: carboxypeptidase regulatory-like domain-containing protein [Aureispira sp.]|nr:carboxypeptidase regulatory-like domain-containing protein [Aureispira sp.]